MAFGEAPKTRATALWLFLFFAAALTLRIAFSVDAGFDDDSGRHIFTGNDPYYHDRALRALVEDGEVLTHDPGINYPDGRANPNPPLFVWSAAPWAYAFDAAGAEDPTGLALNVTTAIWGALIIVPVFLLARDLWGRTAGLWAAFFTAISAPYIQRSVWGYADHDGFTMFFITLAFYFMAKAFSLAKARDYVSDWRKPAAIWAGKKLAVTENKRSFVFALLAGLALSACALAWKGYPYALAVLAVGLGLQLIADHLRSRDATATFLLYLVPLVVVVLVPYLLFYRMYPEFLHGTIYPSLYVLVGVLVAGLVLVPTRALPSILVFPVLLVAAGLGLVVMLVVFPSVGNTVFSGLGYFNQSKLYTTIAEAQRAQLGFVAASFGFFTFLLGFWGYGKAVKGAWKGQPALMLVASWATVAFFMAFAASRFVMNAVPIFAILIGAAMAALLARLGMAEVGRRWRSTHGQGLFARAGKSLTWKSSLGTAFVALFLVLPNVWIGVDAAIPAEYEQDKDLSSHFFGAFGISFDLRDNGWLETQAYLAQQDTGLALEDRPAVIAWWDYGHWNVGIGQHPTVADPFQSHFELAGRFLASESEEEAMSWLTLLLVGYDWGTDQAFSPGVAAALDAAHPGLSGSLAPTLSYDDQYSLLEGNVTGDEVYTLYDAVTEATGKKVGYLAADIRMFPFGARNSGIFYAPVFLANKNPDDFLSTRLSAGSTTLTIQQYGVDADGNSFRLSEPRYVDQAGTEWVAYNGYAYRPGQTPLQGFGTDSGISLFSGQEQLVPTAKFTNSMYARAYGSFSANVAPCNGLTHWRAVQQSIGDYYGIPDSRATALCAYYSGTDVSGRITETSGAPMAGATVTVVDGFGASHAVATTDADGRYTVLSPPGEDLKLTVKSGTVAIGSRALSVDEDATAIAGVDLAIAPGTLTGRAFENLDGVAGFNASADRALDGVTIQVAGKTATTGADGTYTVPDVRAGAHALTASKAGFNNATQTATLTSGNLTTLDVPLAVKQSTVTLRFLDNGQPVGTIPMQITGTVARTVTTNAQGNATATLGPGAYHVKVDYNVTVGGVAQHYVADQDFTVPAGGAPLVIVINRQ